jgi:NitT/TauT family transport system permease protein
MTLSAQEPYVAAQRRGWSATALRDPALALVLPAALVALWQAATAGGASLVPPPTVVWAALVDFAFGHGEDAFSGTLVTHVLASFSRVLSGFALASIAAVPLGLLIGRSSLARRLVDPLLQFMRPVPVTAWLPLSMILFGLGPRPAYFLVFLAAFYPILFNTVFGVKSVEPRLFEAAAMLGCGPSAQFSRVVLPAALPSIFTGLRLGLGFSWIIIVVAEMTGVSTGLGAVIMDARELSRTEIVICGMIVIGLCGFLSDRALMLVGRKLLAWSPQHG